MHHTHMVTDSWGHGGECHDGGNDGALGGAGAEHLPPDVVAAQPGALRRPGGDHLQLLLLQPTAVQEEEQRASAA